MSETTGAVPIVHVAVGVLVDPSTGAVLVARRPEHAHQGGCWEFPGGKVETGETVIAALQRELREELGIELDSAEPFLQVSHAYPEKTVLLNVWRVDAYRGEPHGREGQPLVWLKPEDMLESSFPAADAPIIEQLRAMRN
ncbi:MAG: 8-oxo-dGTP diphosphatase MutT [Candidatus Competibacter denitrificans]